MEQINNPNNDEPLDPSYRARVVEVLQAAGPSASASTLSTSFEDLNVNYPPNLHSHPSLRPSEDLRAYTPQVLTTGQYDPNFNSLMFQKLSDLSTESFPSDYYSAVRSVFFSFPFLHTPSISIDRIPFAYLQQLRLMAKGQDSVSPSHLEISVKAGVNLDLDARHFRELTGNRMLLSEEAIGCLERLTAAPPSQTNQQEIYERAKDQVIHEIADGLLKHLEMREQERQANVFARWKHTIARWNYRELFRALYQKVIERWRFTMDLLEFWRNAGLGTVMLLSLISFLVYSMQARPQLWVRVVMTTLVILASVRMIAKIYWGLELSDGLLNRMPPIYRTATSAELLVQYIPPHAYEYLDDTDRVVASMRLKPSYLQILTILIATIEPSVCDQWVGRLKARRKMHVSAVEIAQRNRREMAQNE